MTLYFFGDSWSSEKGELESWHLKNGVTPDEPLRSYPAMVSETLEIPYKNFSIPGSSNLNMIDQLVNSGATKGDHAVFSLTAGSRRFYYDDHGTVVHLGIDQTKGAVSVYQDSWLSALSCFTLYSYCVKKEIQPWFISTFDILYHNRIADHHPLWNSIPDSVWIISKDSCSVQKDFDPDWYNVANKNLTADFYNWINSDRESVKKYIRPCNDHPNLEGRKKIAQTITLKLKNKIKESTNVGI